MLRLPRSRPAPPPAAPGRPGGGLVVQRHGEVGQERVRAGLGELAVDGDGFLDRGQRLLPPPQVGQADRLVVQRHGEVGQERVGAGLGELAVDGGGFLDRGQRLLPPPQVGQAAGLVVQRHGEVGQERVGRAWASWR